jgi:hypothetical protein
LGIITDVMLGLFSPSKALFPIVVKPSGRAIIPERLPPPWNRKTAYLI